MSLPAPSPVFDPQLDADQAALEQAMLLREQMDEQRKKLLAMAAAIKNPFEAMVVLMMNVIPSEMSEQEAGISELAGSSNIMSDLRRMLADAQKGISDAGNTTDAEGQALVNFVNQLEAKLNDPNFPVDPSTKANILDALKDIKDSFGADWGSGAGVAADLNAWGKVDPSNPQPSAFLKDVSNDLQTINQSVSAMSTTTNTQLQFQTEQYKQIMGTFNDMLKTLIQQNATPIQNFKSVG